MSDDVRLVNAAYTRNEWYAIINALRHTGATYVNEHSGVDLTALADRIADRLLKSHYEFPD